MSLNGDDGLCCVAAVFIQDYDSDMEGLSWDDLVKLHHQSGKHRHLVGDLQVLHDSDYICHWLSQMKVMASYYKLDTTFLEPWYWDEDAEKYVKKES